VSLSSRVSTSAEKNFKSYLNESFPQVIHVQAEIQEAEVQGEKRRASRFTCPFLILIMIPIRILMMLTLIARQVCSFEAVTLPADTDVPATNQIRICFVLIRI
jgi:hypothetical protein